MQQNKPTGKLSARTIMGMVLGIGLGAAIGFFINPVLGLVIGGLMGGVVGGGAALMTQKTPDAHSEQTAARGEALAPEVTPPVPQPLLSPSKAPSLTSPDMTAITAEQRALAAAADALEIPYQPQDIANEQDSLMVDNKERMQRYDVAALMETEKDNMAVLAAYARGEVPDKEALAAYRNVRKEVSEPLVEEAVKFGVEMAMKRAGMGGYSTELTGEILAKPLSRQLGKVMESGALEKGVAFGSGGLTMKVAQACVKQLFPERAQKEVSGEALELDLARHIGQYALHVQNKAPAAAMAR